ncbi:MAG TPA: apolipoprotein N-acyltransferase [Micropepsaceae bacterium]|nr:apolipoprotein N-acyltransferase [Micropepsaceae bacterium]
MKDFFSRTRSGAQGLAQRVSQLRLKPAMLVALIAGVLATLMQAPFGLWPLMFLVWPVCILLLDSTLRAPRPLRAAFAIGWAFGFGSFISGLYWIGNSFLVDAETHGWIMPFAMTILPAGLGLFTGLAFLLARRFRVDGWRRIIWFAAAFSLIEFMRGHVLTGFPWNMPGQIFSENIFLIQSASLFGAYGLNLIVLVMGASVATLADNAAMRARVMLPSLSLVALGALMIFGALRLPAGEDWVDGVRIRIIQPNVPQAEKYVPELRQRNWRRLIAPLLDVREAGITHVVWPEAAPPFLLDRSDDALAVIKDLLGDIVLMTGAARVEEDASGERFFNSFHVIRDGRILATYDKAHLVPFGEYLPLSGLLEALGLTKIIGGGGNFSEGPGVATLTVPGAPPMGPLICYEVIFPAEVADDALRPAFLVNVTDDSWFGDTIGPQQHLAQARLRAVEEGLPIVRAANTGVSALIDPYGRILSRLPYGSEGAIDVSLPASLSGTLFMVAGRSVFILLFILAVFIRASAHPVFVRTHNKNNAQVRLSSFATQPLTRALHSPMWDLYPLRADRA